MPEDELKLRFDPGTIEHLGIKMYSQLPYALAELIANAYDAAAERVEVDFYDSDNTDKKIIITDDGDGMSYEDIRDKFLVIGRKRRNDDQERENSKRRKITGRKGLGKLALFGIGKNIKIESTTISDTEKTVFILDWDQILAETSGEYTLNTYVEEKGDFAHGTRITLSNLSRISEFNLSSISASLSKMFNFIDETFAVVLKKNDEEEIKISREMRYSGIVQQFSWDLEAVANSVESDYAHKGDLKGLIVSSEKPMRQDLRGISLYANGRLVNMPGFFGISEAGHTFTYISGWIDADFLDESAEDLISTDRQSLHWDMPETQELEAYLRKVVRFLVRDWSAKRKQVKESRQTQRTGIDIQEWMPNVPEQIRDTLAEVVNSVGDDPTVGDEDFSNVVKNLYELIPPYTLFHYRYLNKNIQDSSKEKYANEDYYGALLEACKRYIDSIKLKVKSEDPSSFDSLPSNDRGLMGKVFGQEQGKLLKFMSDAVQSNGLPFPDDTKNNLEDAQMLLSQGIVTGYRNPLSHTEHSELSDSGMITEQHCLDALSLLSLLFYRLENSKKCS